MTSPISPMKPLNSLSQTVHPVDESWSPSDALLVFLTVAVPALVVLALALSSGS
jgi:hypothetical protein